jgi:hypothetical protein
MNERVTGECEQSLITLRANTANREPLESTLHLQQCTLIVVLFTLHCTTLIVYDNIAVFFHCVPKLVRRTYILEASFGTQGRKTAILSYTIKVVYDNIAVFLPCVPKVARTTYILEASFGTQGKRKPRYFHTRLENTVSFVVVWKRFSGKISGTISGNN